LVSIKPKCLYVFFNQLFIEAIKTDTRIIKKVQPKEKTRIGETSEMFSPPPKE